MSDDDKKDFLKRGQIANIIPACTCIRNAPYYTFDHQEHCPLYVQHVIIDPNDPNLEGRN